MSVRKTNIFSLKKGVHSILHPEAESAFVRVAHRISSNNSKSQVIKIGDKYFRVKELG